MSVEKQIQDRSNNVCELCQNTEKLTLYTLPPQTQPSIDYSLMLCPTCYSQIEITEGFNVNHWRCLNESMWSEHQAVQIASWRMLNKLKHEGWPQDLLDMMYLEDEALSFAKATLQDNNIVHKDSNGVVLQQGDSVVLIKDLPVKGSSIVAKRGTTVRKISLDRDNAEYIEGKVDGQQIVILTKYVKKV